jgi:hypothetical protein
MSDATFQKIIVGVLCVFGVSMSFWMVALGIAALQGKLCQ